MKIVALLSGILASAFAWAAMFFVLDLSVPFLALWPDTNSQQLLGLVAWHAFVASALLGGLIATLSPVLGGMILIGAGAGWAGLGHILFGFPPQVVGPIAFCALGAIACLGAVVRGLLRRMAARSRPSLEDMAREDALRLEPDDDLRFALERRAVAGNEDFAESPPQPDAIRIAAARSVQERPQGLSGLFVANVMALLLLTLAVAGLFYVNVRNGQLAAAFSSLPLAPARTAEVAAPVVEAAEPAPETTGTVAASAPVPAAAAADVPEAEVLVTSSPLDVAALPPSSWADPFAYCAAVRTIDFPDRRYTGPNLTEPIAKALNVPVSSPPDRAKWRCYDGALLGCASFRGASCAITPTVREMREYCLQNPNAQNLQAPNGTWSCVETTPELPRGASWPVDARGFLPGAWVEITGPAVPG